MDDNKAFSDKLLNDIKHVNKELEFYKKEVKSLQLQIIQDSEEVVKNVENKKLVIMQPKEIKFDAGT